MCVTFTVLFPPPLSLSLSPVLRYGSHISLRSSELSCWLHSHSHLYPLKYPDDRGSSYQQQVTCYEFADQNNLWAIRRPAGPTTTAVGPDSSPVWNKDLVELVHINTSKILNRSIHELCIIIELFMYVPDLACKIYTCI